MTKKGRTPAYWRSLCNKLAAGEPKPTKQGWTPRPGYWKTTVDKILKCPETIRRQISKGNGQQSTLSFHSNSTATSPCTCEWDHDNETTNTTTTPAAAAPTRPQKEVDFGILKKPKPRSVAFVRGMHRVYKEDGYFDLEVFGYCNGKCPHCKSSEISAGRVNTSVKLIFTKGKPRFVQGIGLSCRACKGQGWQSYEKTYVDTLSKKQQDELHAVIAGKRCGVDTEIIMQMRHGAMPSVIARESLANLTKLHAQWEEEYDENCRIATQNGFDVVERAFPSLAESGLKDYAASSDIVTVGFLRDFISVKPELLRELASLRSDRSMAIDHQRKVVKHAKGNNGASSFTVCGDMGIVMGYYVVPDEGEKWLQDAMMELVKRHGAVLNPDLKTVLIQGNLPKVIYVDKLCCGGTEESRSDAVRYFYGMLKKLDTFHLIQRINKEINCEHPRKPGFLTSLSECIFTLVQEDVDALEQARERGGINNLTHGQQKADRLQYVRTKIENPQRIVSKILVLVKGQIALDRQAKEQSIKIGDNCENINTAHRAYPLITKKILKCVMQQCIHILNGCVHDEFDMNLLTGQAYYRKTQTLLDKYASQRGSNCVEAWHSVADRKVYAITVMRQSLFDGRMLWTVTNFNRERLRKMGKENILPNGVAPSEGSKAMRSTLVESTDLLFGFDYFHHCHRMVQERVQDNVLDSVLEAIENTEDLLVFDVDDDDDDTVTDEESDDEESGRGDDDDDDSVFEPLMTSDIPDEVDADALKVLAETLTADVQCTAKVNPLAMQQPIQDKELKQAINSHRAFKDLVPESDTLAADAGIDVQAHGFPDITAATFEASKKANSRRNVLARTQRSGGGNFVPPNFNDIMKEKFESIWFDENKRNTFQGANVKEWCEYAMSTYEHWRFKEVAAAEQEDKAIPPLLETSYDLVKTWSEEMKELSKKVQRAGAVNTASSELCSQLRSFTKTSSSLEELNMGEAKPAADLSVTVATGADAEAVELPSPTSKEVQRNMEVMVSKPPAAPARKKQKRMNTEFLRRRQIAADVMNKHNILPDSVTSGRRRCKVCDIRIKDFYFNTEHGAVSKDDGVPHLTTNDIKFCPIVDDHSIYHTYVAQKKDAKKVYNDRDYQKWKML